MSFWSGIRRWSIVRPETSYRTAPEPATPSRSGASAGTAPIAPTGTPYTSEPVRNAGNSRSRFPATTANAAPITPPTPTAAFSAPTPV